MSVSQVRTYFNDRVREVDSNLKVWDDAFNIDNVPESLIDTYYHVQYNSVGVSTNNDVSIEDSVSVVITLWKKGFRDPIEAYDSINDLGLCIRLNCLQPAKIALTDNIRQVESVSVLSEPIEGSNDNIIKLSLEFNARLFFKITDFNLT
jgi:hypothetical protein